MGDVIDRWRLNQGWNPYDDNAQELAIQSWVSVLDTENVPHTAYVELFNRALATRAIAIQSGKQLPNFGVELLLAGWIGENGLCREMARRQREAMVNERRYLEGGTGEGWQEQLPPSEGFEYFKEQLKKNKPSNVTSINERQAIQ